MALPPWLPAYLSQEEMQSRGSRILDMKEPKDLKDSGPISHFSLWDD